MIVTVMLSHQSVPCRNVGDTCPLAGVHTGLQHAATIALAVRLFSLLSQPSRLPSPLIASCILCFKAQLSPRPTLSPRLFSGDLFNASTTHNWTCLFSFQFFALGASDSFELLKIVAGHPVPAAAPVP